jgi:hypothetical protein
VKGILYARLAVELIDNAFTTCMIKKVMDNRRLIIYTMTPLNLITNVKRKGKRMEEYTERYSENICQVGMGIIWIKLCWQMPSFFQIWANFLSRILDVEEFQRYDNK